MTDDVRCEHARPVCKITTVTDDGVSTLDPCVNINF